MSTTTNTTGKLTKDFRLSYAGEVEYFIRDDRGRQVAYVDVRHYGIVDFDWNGDYFETGIKPSIGTVRHHSSSEWGEFPGADVMALFPGYVGGRILFHYGPKGHLPINHPDYESPTAEYQWDGPRPVLCPHPDVPGYLTFVGYPGACG